MVVFYKKAISPVVGSALLIVLTVISIVAFQNWFNNYSSSTFVDVEKQSSVDMTTNIETVVGNELYIKSSGQGNNSVINLKINGVGCFVTLNSISSEMNEVIIDGCNSTIDVGMKEVIIQTEDKVISKKIDIKEVILEPTYIPNGTNVVMDVCSNGWTDLGDFETNGRSLPISSCPSGNCSVCKSSGGFISSGTNVVMDTCPSDWQDLGFLLYGEALENVDCYDGYCNTCKVLGSYIPSGTKIVMGICPSGWTDLGDIGVGADIGICLDGNCNVCEKD